MAGLARIDAFLPISLTQEQWLEMSLVKIFGDIAADRFLAFVQHLQITITQFGGDLVSNVQQLSER